MIKVQHKRLVRIEREASMNLYYAELICDKAEELPKPDYYDGWTIDMGSIAHVINTGETYMLNSDGDWKLQKKTSEGGGLTFTEDDKAKLDSLTNPILLKDRVDTFEDLPEEAETGWLYFVGSEGAVEFAEYIFTDEGKWEFIGFNSVDLSNYVQKTDYGNANVAGIVKDGRSRGFAINSEGMGYIAKADEKQVNEEIHDYRPLVPSSIPIFMSSYNITKTTIKEILDRLTALENPE